MRGVAVLFLVAALGASLGGCESDFSKWKRDAVKECQAKPSDIDRQQCLDEIAAVERAHQPGGVGPEPSK
ncbi:MAG TPA: hypothetical protein VG983_02610 [Caulobacterales bacterium]|jgi:hypothetical protein|nr:hypothetical protein [Caulobacterales bacterium]